MAPGDRLRARESGAPAVLPARLVAGRYRLVGELGRGGMGVVWLGEDELVRRRVAIKELRPLPGLAGADREVFARRALLEARSAARIDHPGAVTLYDVVPAAAADDAVYLIMELVQGPTLAELIGRDGALAGPQVAGFGLQLLDVLQTAHGLGIVHRDVKPANIMITAAGQVKLGDFGIAHTAGDTRLTRGGVMGTQAFMAPELFESGAVTAAADLWSLGATLYYAAEGRGAFDRDSSGATLRAIVLDKVPVPGCEPRLAAAISGMLQRDPAQRANVEQARAGLLEAAAAGPPPSAGPPAAGPGPVLDNGPVLDKGPGWARRTTRQVPFRAGDDSSAGHSARRPSRRHVSRQVIVVTAAGALVAAAVLAGGLLSAQHGSSSSLGPTTGAVTRPALRTTIAEAADTGSLALSPNGQMLATYSATSPVTLWNASNGRKIATLPYQTPYKVVFSPDGQMLAVAAGGGRLELWDIAARRTVTSTGVILATTVEFSPDGSTLAVADRRGVQLLHVATRRWSTTLFPDGFVNLNTMAFSPDGQTFAVGGSVSGYVYVLNVSDRRLIATLRPDPGAAVFGKAWVTFSPDSRTLAVLAGRKGQASRVWLWDVASRQRIATLTDPRSAGLTALSSSHRGVLAVGDVNGSVYLWDMASRKLIATLADPAGAASGFIEDVAFSANGGTLATSDSSGHVYIWNVTAGG